MKAEAAIIARNDASELERLYTFLAGFWAENGLPEETSLDVNLALEEIFMNVVMHGYQNDAAHDIFVNLALEDGTVILAIEDDGIAFNPLAARDLSFDVPLEERPIGGLGIHLVRKVMDELEYSRDGSHNRLVMKKRIPGGK